MSMLSVPYLEPPPWWQDGCIDGLTWDELLAREWNHVMNAPKSAAQLKREEDCRRIGQAVAEDMTNLAIQILTAGERDGD